MLSLSCVLHSQSNSNQHKIIDSLINIVDTYDDDFEKIRVLTSNAGQLRYSKDTRVLIDKAIEISRLNNNSIELSNSYYALGNYYYFNTKLDSSIYYLDKASHYLKDQNDPMLLATILNTKGGVYKKQGKLPLATEINVEAKKKLESIDTLTLSNDDMYQLKRRLVIVNNSLAILCINTENFEKALQYFDDAIETSKTLKEFSKNVPVLMSNKGDLLMNMNKLNEALSVLKEAKALKVKNEFPLRSIATTDLTLGQVLIKLKNYDDALIYLDDALINYEKSEHQFGITNTLQEKGNLLLITNKTTEAKKACEKAKSIADSIDDKEFIMKSCDCLYKVEKKLGNFKQALSYFETFITIEAESFNKEQNEKVEQLITKYDFEKKEAELKVLKLEAEKSEQQKLAYTIAALIGMIIALIIAYFLYKNYKKNKLLAKQTKLLETSIDEKNVLLKETHHRVKNSFQIVSSLLYLQSESVEDKEAKIAIKEAENRVRSMVLIHQKLYNKDELVGINTKDYFSDLTHDIFESHQFNGEPINYELQAEPLVLDIESITPIGLILNELITNTLKHAFNDNSKGHTIQIIFYRENQNLILKVIDNGQGFEGEIKSTSFGITLMKALSKKLNATLNYNSKRDSGTEAILTIKKFNIL
ncbi:histidine kinase dimerization/phosphoacceptor domain -containing protein [uncultured Winogradskyella sp.]|uniref:histidine kinase dimerization/phosphoacceptor domain -containing protein n=1 Tax=uncultured Winogradskyella sp. TaxID=395353 RepID=UPI00261D6BAA|nr:histidine kinase dimerization/phosphoacceptor domain -containing protein [uncultured Winogradskyella sp.]